YASENRNNRGYFEENKDLFCLFQSLKTGATCVHAWNPFTYIILSGSSTISISYYESKDFISKLRDRGKMRSAWNLF
ncbi:11734_t:CDS:2, partial [Gigaspora rosea]